MTIAAFPWRTSGATTARWITVPISNRSSRTVAISPRRPAWTSPPAVNSPPATAVTVRNERRVSRAGGLVKSVIGGSDAFVVHTDIFRMVRRLTKHWINNVGAVCNRTIPEYLGGFAVRAIPNRTYDQLHTPHQTTYGSGVAVESSWTASPYVVRVDAAGVPDSVDEGSVARLGGRRFSGRRLLPTAVHMFAFAAGAVRTLTSLRWSAQRLAERRDSWRASSPAGR